MVNEEKKRILQMVEEGRLTVNEALRLLEELEKANKEKEQKEEKLVSELSSVIHFEEAKKNQSTNYKVQSAKDKIFEFVDTAIKKIKDIDLDFNFGQAIEVSHVFHQADAYLKEMDIDIANGSVNVVPWDQSDVRVECEVKVYRVENIEAARNTFLKEVLFAVEGQRLRFSTQQKWMKLQATIYVPKTEFHQVKIRMFNGPISSENLLVTSYKVKTANGKISMRNISSKYVEAETANGPIYVAAGKIDQIEAETINGAITMDGEFKKIDVHSFNGDIECTSITNLCERIEAKATTGAIKLYLPKETALSGELKSNLGGFHVDFDGIHVTEEKNEVVQKYIRFEPEIQTQQVTKLYVDTKTGSITVRKTY